MEKLSKKKTTKIELQKEEKKGLITLMIFYFISWGLLVTPFGYMRLVAWVSLGLIGLAMWKIMDQLIERSNTK